MNGSSLPDLLQQITARYRTALLANLSVLAALGVGCVSVLAWRLHAVGFDPARVVGIAGALALVAIATLGWWGRHRWIDADETAAHLDRALGLQQRLMTAAEFAHREPVPALYPFLTEDTANRFSSGQVRFPRVVDRPSVALAIVLLLLLCWPGRGSVPMQLAPLDAPAHPPTQTSAASGAATAGSEQQTADRARPKRPAGWAGTGQRVAGAAARWWRPTAAIAGSR
jgi:hypothetical protein